ncbi:MAG: SH3 domain-containing protein, partial [Phototrophicaceae bacterium]
MTRRIIVLLLVFIVAASLAFRRDDGASQVNAQALSPTPVPLNFPTAEPLATRIEQVATAIPTFTPTEPGPAVLQPREGAGDINLRLEPDLNSELVGTLRPGEQYVVTGRYFRWYQIRFEESRTGRAFVFGDLVDVIGEEAEIPDLTQVEAPTLDPAIVGPTQTFEAVIAVPGGAMTLTAAAQPVDAPANAVPGAPGVLPDGAAPANLPANAESTREVLPTFTFPANVVAQAPTRTPEGAAPDPTAALNTATVDVS